MNKFFSRFEGLFIIVSTIFITIVLFRGYFIEHKILFPSNLLVSTYSPWKYEPVPEYPNGPPNKPMGFDDIRQFFPNRLILKETLEQGIIPLWNPYIYSGVPFMASFDTAIWYPFSLIATLLPVIEGWNFLVIIQPVASVLFMYLLLKSLKFRPSIAVYGAFAYAFCGWMIVYWQEILVLEHSFLWLPLALYASNRLWERTSDTLGFVLLIFALVNSVFGGFFQMSLYVYGVVLIWNLYSFLLHRKETHARRIGLFVGLAFVLSLLVVCIQLIPSFQAFSQSPRGAGDGSFVFTNGLLTWKHLITLLAPDYWGNPATYNYFGGIGFYFEKMIFIGVIPLLFAVYGMIKANHTVARFWIILGLISFSMGFALPTSWLPYFLHIPVLSSSYPTRIFAVSSFSFIIMSCYGLELFMRSPDRKRMMYILAGLTAVLVAGWIVVIGAPGWVGRTLSITRDAKFYSTVSLRNLFIPTAFLLSGWGLVLLSKYMRSAVFLTVCVLTIASSAYFAQKYVQFGEERFVYPKLPVIDALSKLSGYDRVWGYGNAFIEKNVPQYFHWFSTDGYGNLSSGRYAELLATAANDGKLHGTVRRSDTDLFETSEDDRFGSAHPYRSRLMSLFGVKYVLELKKSELKDKLTTEERFPPSEFTLVWEDPVWRIWQYTEALPRAVFATNYIVRTRPQEIVDALYDRTVNLSRTVVLEREPTELLRTQENTAEATGSAVIASYGLNSVTITTESQVDGFVVLSDTYYPGWMATVDGKQKEIYRADYTIRAVAVPKGSHTVVFSYKPVTFVIGAALTITGIVVTVYVSLMLGRSKRRGTLP